MVRTDGAVCCAFVAVRDLPGVGGVFPGRAFLRIENGVAAVFDVRGQLSALHPGVCGARVEVQFAYLWRCADADFGNVQCVVFDIFDLHLISMAKRLTVLKEGLNRT